LKFWIFSVISAVAATLCCLPALVFLLFGASFAFLGVFEPLGAYRAYFTVFAIVFFVLFSFYFFKKKVACPIKKVRTRRLIFYIFLFLILVFLLSYPEILGSFYA